MTDISFKHIGSFFVYLSIFVLTKEMAHFGPQTVENTSQLAQHQKKLKISIHCTTIFCYQRRNNKINKDKNLNSAFYPALKRFYAAL